MQFERGANGAIVSTKPRLEQDPKTGRFLPGNSGFGGRPRGARSKLAEVFLKGMLDAFERGGQQAIDEVMRKSPAKFIQALTAILPKQVELDADVSIKVTTAVDSLVSRLTALAKRDEEYAQDRQDAIKVIEYVPVEQTGPIVSRFERESVGSSTENENNSETKR